MLPEATSSFEIVEGQRPDFLKSGPLSPLQQVSLFIDKGFHDALDEHSFDYLGDFEQAMLDAQDAEEIDGTFIAIVESRLSFLKQAELLGFMVDPSLIQSPKHYPEQKPYTVRLQLIHQGHPYMQRGLTPRKITDILSQTMRPATAFEGIAASFFLEDDMFFHTVGGEFYAALNLTNGNPQTHTIVFDQFLGRKRVMQAKRNEFDGLVGYLAAFQQSSRRNDRIQQ
ncbi:MAG: hypothetical protein Q8R11_01765 [bacterium]|nr:hypothetical protein [bacterium]